MGQPAPAADSVEVNPELVVGKIDSWIDGFMAMLPNIGLAVLLLIVAMIAGKLVARSVARIAARRDRANLGDMLRGFVKWAIYVCGALATMSIAGLYQVQQQFAQGTVLDFGGGIGTHALAAAALPQVDAVWFVDLNPENRRFVQARAERFGLAHKLRCFRDLDAPELPAQFDTIVCLDVLEHLSDPSAQLEQFAARMSPGAIALLNWYFFKGHAGEYPFHFDEPQLVERFFRTLQSRFLEVFHPFLITTRAYRLL